MNHDLYVDEKTLYSYKLTKEGRFFEKVRAIILNADGRVLLIRDTTNGNITVPGGGVDEGESAEEAVVREAMEEAGIKVTPVKVLDKNFYDVKMNYKGEEFISKRVEYFFMCKLKPTKCKLGVVGVDGEYKNKMEIGFFPISTMKGGKFSTELICKIEQEV